MMSWAAALLAACAGVHRCTELGGGQLAIEIRGVAEFLAVWVGNVAVFKGKPATMWLGTISVAQFGSSMNDEQVRVAVRAALEAAWGPAGTPETLDRATDVILRRWRSFDRRCRVPHPTTVERIEDLVKGLRDAFESDRRFAGPMMTEYRASAEAAAAALLQGLS